MEPLLLLELTKIPQMEMTLVMSAYINIVHLMFGWNPLGGDIDGEAANDRSGWSVSLNSDGTIVAIGARFNDGDSGSTMIGHVRVYEYDATKETADTDQSSAILDP